MIKVEKGQKAKILNNYSNQFKRDEEIIFVEEKEYNNEKVFVFEGKTIYGNYAQQLLKEDEFEIIEN